MKKKAQVAMESLMIYGIALLIVALAIGALIYFGVLDLGAMLPDKCDLRGAKIICENYVINKDGDTCTAQFEFRNQVGKNIDISAVSIAAEEDFVGVYSDGSASPSETVVNGELSDAIGVDMDDCGLNPGKKLKGRLTVTYKVVGSDIEQKAVGTIDAKIA